MKLKYCIASLLALPIISACSSTPLNPVIPKPIPFAVDKAGNKIVIDFEARPDNVKLNEEYMVTLLIERANDARDPIVFLGERPPLPFKLKIMKVDGEFQAAIKLKGNGPSEKFNTKKYPTAIEQDVNNDIIYARIERGSSGKGEVSVAGFYPQSYGNYRAEIETLQNQPNLAKINSHLTIQKYFIGK